MNQNNSQDYSVKRTSGGRGWVAFLLVTIAIAGVGYFAATHHIVNTRQGIKIYAKGQPGFGDTYVDMTSMSFSQLRYHSEVVSAMTHNGDLALVPGGEALLTLQRAGQNVGEALTRFDSEYQISSSVSEAARITKEKYQAMDQKYDISGKAEKARDEVKKKADQLNDWLKKK